MARVLLIASGAYVEPELEAEFGRIPPAFLPVGNRRLFVQQRAAAGEAFDTILMSVPEDFEIEATDKEELDRLGITVVPVPTGLTLGNSIVYVINLMALSRSSFALLHGDTLIKGIADVQDDCVTVAPAPAGYTWGVVREAKGQLVEAKNSAEDTSSSNFVLSGCFTFKEAALVVQTITRRGGNFLQGLTAYSAKRPMKVLRDFEWLDFGHANTYYQSRMHLTTEREFNTIRANRRSITKSGRDARKISAEANWFEKLPGKLKIFTPAYLGRDDSADAIAYSLEYLNQSTLSDLFVFGRLPRRSWERIFAACNEFLEACSEFRPASFPHSDAGSLYLDKTLSRLEDFARRSGLSLNTPCRLNGFWLPSLEQMARLAAERIRKPAIELVGLVHGDLCFSNIMYDFRAQMVSVIDPRGIDGSGQQTVYGDIRYDLGKLYHSVAGRYDHIMAGRFSVNANSALDFAFEVPSSEHLRSIEQAFLERRFRGVSMTDADAPAIAVLLFLSMLPLHSDDVLRQTGLLANALRLFLNLDS